MDYRLLLLRLCGQAKYASPVWRRGAGGGSKRARPGLTRPRSPVYSKAAIYSDSVVRPALPFFRSKPCLTHLNQACAPPNARCDRGGAPARLCAGGNDGRLWSDCPRSRVGWLDDSRGDNCCFRDAGSGCDDNGGIGRSPFFGHFLCCCHGQYADAADRGFGQ